jgi:hypothetical protein
MNKGSDIVVKIQQRLDKIQMSKEESKKMSEILDILKSNQSIIWFLEPVTDVRKIFFNIFKFLAFYKETIKKPMDVSTISKNLRKSKYKKVVDLFNDVQLMWDNCKLFNVEGSVKKIIII